MESFKKFKKKIVLETFIKCLSISISFGLLTFSAPYLYIKLNEIEFNSLFLILIGLGISLVLFIILYLIKKPNDKMIAIRLDNELDLNEKVQTMVEYREKDTLMANLQREQTLNILSNTSIKSIAMKFSIFFFILIIISLSFSVVAFAIPGHEEIEHIHEFINGECECGEKEYVEPDYDLDDWTVKAILEIINEVRNSNANDSLKTKYIDKLNELITKLKEVSKEKEVKSWVEEVIDYTNLELDKVNTNNEIYMILKESDFSGVVSIALQINFLKVNELEKALENIIVTISGSSEAVNELKAQFLDLLVKSNLDKEDELYKTLVRFADEINKCAKTDLSININEDIKNVVKNNSEPIIEIVKLQAENSRVAIYIEEKLSEIFMLNEVEIETPDRIDIETEDPEKDKNTDSSNQGGLGDGEYLFGSDDLFFDPETGSVKYGDVFFEYYGLLLSKFEDGTLPEEYREIFDYYFGILGGDANKKNRSK